jgi:hypothetical protein
MVDYHLQQTRRYTMNKKITLSIAAMLMASSQVQATTTTDPVNALLSADSSAANIESPDMTTVGPEMENIATAYLTAIPSLSNSQFTQQLPNSSMAFTTTGPTITPSATLADSGINTSALHENMAMAQNVGATQNTAFNMLSSNAYDSTSNTDSSSNTFTNSANTASNEGSGAATQDNEDPKTDVVA